MERVSRTSRSWPALLILGGVYCAVVWISLGRTPLWLDELQQLDSSRQRTIHQIVEWAKLNPAAVPLPYIVQQAFIAIFGFSTVVARAPAAIASILGGFVFVCVARPLADARGSEPSRDREGVGLWTAVLFLAAPLQFRYALEARGYSLALLFSLLTLLIFLELCRHPSIQITILYGLAIVLGLYSQPFSLFPVVGQLIWLARRPGFKYALIAAGAACATFVPWYLEQADAKNHYARMAVYFFSWHQVTPWTVLHEFPGGGYLPSIALFSLAAYAVWRGSLKEPREQLLLFTAVVSIVAPIVADAVGGYFFAVRQLLFALPPMVLLAGMGLDRLWKERRALTLAALAIFLIPAAIKDYRDATIPKDDLAATADRIEAELTPDTCVLIAPRNQIAYYAFFHPDVQLRACPAVPDSATVLAADSGQYTAPEEHAEMSAVLASAYEPGRSIMVGRARITLYRRR